MASSVPQLSHLQARYCKRISDAGVQAIARHLESLYTLDLSFCTKIHASAIYSLLEIRGGTLAELRLQSCHNLDIGFAPDGTEPNGTPAAEAADAGGMILKALALHGDTCCLSALDVRGCGGQPNGGAQYRVNDPFVISMARIGFQQPSPGYFVRPARWNAEIERHLVGQFITDKRHFTAVKR